MKDTIYREDAIKAIKDNSFAPGVDYLEINGYGAIDDIRALPSADIPQGEWIKFGLGRGTRILFCTNCERRIEVPLSQGDSNYDYCPNCGARMKGAEDD